MAGVNARLGRQRDKVFPQALQQRGAELIDATANATLQLNSSQQMRGRVMSLYAIAFLGTTPIGAPLVGLIVSWSNPRVGIAVGSSLALATGVGLVFSHRRDERNVAQLQAAQTA